MSMHPKYEVGMASQDELDRLWRQDPFLKDPDLTTGLLNLYFKHINSAGCSIFPQDQFMQWVEHDTIKSLQDLMVVYSMMTVASQFYSGDHDLSAIQTISHYAVGRQSEQASLQLVQSRLLLALSEYGFGRSDCAWDTCGSAFRTISAIRLNLEEAPIVEHPSLPFRLSIHSYAECRRRTYWATYITDVSLVTELTPGHSYLTNVLPQRVYDHVAGHISTPRDVHGLLRLPMTETAFLAAQPNSCQSFLHLAMATSKTPSADLQGLGPMAHLILISAIWNNVLGNLCHSMHKAGDLYSNWYEDLIRESTQQLKVWAENLPPRLRYSHEYRQNLDYNISHGQGGEYVAMHSLYYITLMKLNRHGRFQHMRHTLIAAIVRDAVHAAEEYLEFVFLVASRDKSKQHMTEFVPPPFTGFAITTACDIISAKGRSRDIPQIVERMLSGISVLEELSPFWASCEAQKSALQRRIKDLSILSTAPRSNAEDAHYGNDPFSLSTPMEQTFRLDGDLIYSATVKVYLGAMEGILSVNVSSSHRGQSSR